MNLKIYVSICILALGSQLFAQEIRLGAACTEQYVPLLKNKNVALVVNHTSMVGSRHIADSLLGLGVAVVRIFAPEHGFRGTGEAGELIADGKDARTGVAVVSLYGKKKKPSPADLKGIDVVIFDIQDVGARFYTYISTLHYVMEACAENNLPLLVLDRPNPNGHYVAGCVLQPGYQSFVGMHPVPIVHGLTVGEYATMINGEGWLPKAAQCSLRVVKVAGYTHKYKYTVPIKPSPNLNTQHAIYLYPSLCLFEGARVSVGRGTPTPFAVVGSPSFTKKSFSFVPVPVQGASLNPDFKNQKCYGYNLYKLPIESLANQNDISLKYLLEFYKNAKEKDQFFNDFFDKLAGTDALRKQIVAGKTEKQIKLSWQPELKKYKAVRKKYLLYPDFE